ncbi:hypothetical protein GOODEAATRI_003937 [Goodea atripinnis]|uniref:Uncharacterized protein n=1 Tax=Goodea atripinnis TaxID=208336 RepID=A0ABV0MGV4_9TELE
MVCLIVHVFLITVDQTCGDVCATCYGRPTFYIFGQFEPFCSCFGTGDNRECRSRHMGQFHCFFFSEMILSLQMPLASLMRDIALAVNTSHLNISELTVEMQLAIERTLQAAQQPYFKAAFKAMSHILDNYDLNESSSSSQELIEEAAMIFLTSANITLNDIFPMMSGNASGLNLDLLGETMGEIIKLIIETRVFGHSPEVYQALEHLLATNSTYIMVERVYEMSVWLASTEASGLELLSQGLSKMYEIIRLPLSILTKLSMDVDTEAYEELFGNMFAAFNQFVGTNGLYPPMLQHHYVSYSEMSDGHHIMRNRRKRDLSPMMTRDPMQDIIDLFHIDYPAMFRAISVPPTTAEITETAHVLFANPDLNVVMKGATSGMPWSFNASREATIDATLGMFSLFTHPQLFEM